MKKIISLVLALIMIMSVAVVGFSAMAADDDVAITEVTDEATGETEETEEAHRNFYNIFWDFCVEIYEFFRYIFYGIYIGEPA